MSHSIESTGAGKAGVKWSESSQKCCEHGRRKIRCKDCVGGRLLGEKKKMNPSTLLLTVTFC
jgi:hypothetical protein